MKCVVGTFLLFLSLTNALTQEYVYEFGYDVGNVIYVKDGYISLFHHITKVDLPVPEGTKITYIKVTVDGYTPPKVDYDSDTRKVNPPAMHDPTLKQRSETRFRIPAVEEH